MPKRQNVVKVASDDVQGEDSWAKVRRLTVREMRALIKKRDEAPTDAERFDTACQMYISHVVEWNWVDDDEKPMPQPTKDPSILEELTNVEVMFLSNALTGEGAEAKNSPSS